MSETPSHHSSPSSDSSRDSHEPSRNEARMNQIYYERGSLACTPVLFLQVNCFDQDMAVSVNWIQAGAVFPPHPELLGNTIHTQGQRCGCVGPCVLWIAGDLISHYDGSLLCHNILGCCQACRQLHLSSDHCDKGPTCPCI